MGTKLGVKDSTERESVTGPLRSCRACRITTAKAAGVGTPRGPDGNTTAGGASAPFGA